MKSKLTQILVLIFHILPVCSISQGILKEVPYENDAYIAEFNFFFFAKERTIEKDLQLNRSNLIPSVDFGDENLFPGDGTKELIFRFSNLLFAEDDHIKKYRIEVKPITHPGLERSSITPIYFEDERKKKSVDNLNLTFKVKDLNFANEVRFRCLIIKGKEKIDSTLIIQRFSLLNTIPKRQEATTTTTSPIVEKVEIKTEDNINNNPTPTSNTNTNPDEFAKGLNEDGRWESINRLVDNKNYNQALNDIRIFKIKYPSSKYLESINQTEVDIRQELGWQTAVGKNTPQAYQLYLKTYPDGKYRTIASKKSGPQKNFTRAQNSNIPDPEDELWTKLIMKKDTSGIRIYLADNPYGKYADQAISFLPVSYSGSRNAIDQNTTSSNIFVEYAASPLKLISIESSTSGKFIPESDLGVFKSESSKNLIWEDGNVAINVESTQQGFFNVFASVLSKDNYTFTYEDGNGEILIYSINGSIPPLSLIGIKDSENQQSDSIIAFLEGGIPPYSVRFFAPGDTPAAYEFELALQQVSQGSNSNTYFIVKDQIVKTFKPKRSEYRICFTDQSKTEIQVFEESTISLENMIESNPIISLLNQYPLYVLLSPLLIILIIWVVVSNMRKKRKNKQT